MDKKSNLKNDNSSYSPMLAPGGACVQSVSASLSQNHNAPSGPLGEKSPDPRCNCDEVGEPCLFHTLWLWNNYFDEMWDIQAEFLHSGIKGLWERVKPLRP